MAIPSDLPDGTILYRSPVSQLKLNCTYDPGPGIFTSGVGVYYSTTSDFNTLQSQNNGIKLTIYINDVPVSSAVVAREFARSSQGNPSVFSSDVNIYFTITVDRNRGSIPESGTQLSGSFESVYFYIKRLEWPRAVIGFYTPKITAIPCSMDMTISPNTLNWGAIQTSKLESGQGFSKNFSIVLKKRSTCTIYSAAPFGANIWFDRAGQNLNPDGSLDLNNGTGLSIKDNSGTVVAYDTNYQIPDVKVESVLTRSFTAQIKKTNGKDLKTGSFSTVLVIRMNYY
ncbi:fimbrial protein [Enterobacter hormaechei]|nr:fimbrial protein [Enterobacter hormaechei]